ncbi:hypothetical protein KIPE111705_02735 [Kibdelosporangium persicum]
MRAQGVAGSPSLSPPPRRRRMLVAAGAIAIETWACAVR